jgi:hypothetical protein
MIIDSLPGAVPLVRAIDDWFQNRPLALLFEAKVGTGSLLVCSADLMSDADLRPSARQLLASLTRYASGSDFRPTGSVDIQKVKDLFN